MRKTDACGAASRRFTWVRSSRQLCCRSFEFHEMANMKNILQKQRRDAMNIEIRMFQVASDLPSVLDTENACGEGNWDDRTVADFHFRQDAVMKVATLPNSRYVVGHYAVTISKEEVWLRRLAVKPSFRHRGIGATLLRDALDIARRRRIPFGTDYDVRATYWFSV